MQYSFNVDELKEALSKVDEYYINLLPKDREIHYQFSHKFKRRMKKLIRTSKKTEIVNKSFGLGKKIAVFIAMVLIVFAFTTSVSSAVQNAVYNFIFKIYEKYTEVFFEGSRSIPNNEFVALKPFYIPDGFIVNIENVDTVVFLEYIKENDYIIYEQIKKEDVSARINTEGIIVEEIEINGYRAIYYSNKGIQNIIWYDDTYMYSIYSTLDKDEVYRIAKSVQ